MATQRTQLDAWIVELDGVVMGSLVRPVQTDMFWVRYDVEPVDDAARETLLRRDLWVECRLTFRDPLSRRVALHAFSAAGRPAPLPDGMWVVMRALYLPPPRSRSWYPPSMASPTAPHRPRRVLAILGAALFGILAVLTALRVDALQRADEAGIRAIGDLRVRLGEKAAKLDRHLMDVTALGGEADMTLVGLLGVGYLLAAGRRGAALGAITASLGGFIVNQALKHAFARPRPELFDSAVGHPASPSFPSGHAMATMAIFVSLAWLLTKDAAPRARRFALASAVLGASLVALTRPLLGVHWPSDIVGGAALGVTLAVAGIEVACALGDEA